MQIVSCPAPLRQRQDDRIVEIFLHAYEQGRFFHDPDPWLPQNQTNVEVIASAEDGTKLAIEHTMLFEFDGRLANPDEDVTLGTIVGHLADIHLPVSDRMFGLNFYPKSLGKLISKHRSVVLRELSTWALSVLPTLYENKEFTIPIPVKLPDNDAPTVRVGVEVWPVTTNRPILAWGYLPPSPDIVSLVRQAFRNKLPKLAQAEADLRFLMLEVGTLDTDSKVIQTVYDVAKQFPEISKIERIVFARTSMLWWDGTVFFRLWNPVTQGWSDHLVAKVDMPGKDRAVESIRSASTQIH